jgi:hypothetical protein
MSEPRHETLTTRSVDPATGEVFTEQATTPAGVERSGMVWRRIDNEFKGIRETLKQFPEAFKELNERISLLENGFVPDNDPDFERWLDRFIFDHYVTATQGEWIRTNRALNERFRALHVAARHAFSTKAGPYDRVNWWGFMETAIMRLHTWDEYRQMYEEQDDTIQETQAAAANRWSRTTTSSLEDSNPNANPTSTDTGEPQPTIPETPEQTLGEQP